MSRPDGYLLRGVTPDATIREVARAFNVTTEEILGSSRRRHINTARACAMAVIKEHTDWSYPVIGRYFGRDHTTVMHHVAKVMDDPELAEGVRMVVEELSPPPRLFAVESA